MSDEKKSTKQIQMTMELDSQPKSLVAQIIEDLVKSEDKKARNRINMLSFEDDPNKEQEAAGGLYKKRPAGLPTDLIKRIRDTEQLIGGVIIPTRARQMSLFSRPRASRLDVGFTINLKPDVEKTMSAEDKEKVKIEIIPKLKEILLNCGTNASLTDKEKRNLSQFIYEVAEDICSYGGFATEVIKDEDNKFHSFRARDTGTINFVTKKKEQSQEAEKIREQALQTLSKLQGKDITPSKFDDDQFTYAQVIDGKTIQVFTDDEMIYWNSYPSTDVNRNGYPVSPLERILESITTHINLTTTNKMFFINGRSYKNILVFKTEDGDKEDLINIKNQMSAHMNSAGAAHRLPVFGIKPTDEINVIPLDNGAKDMEFQYLSDLNKRMIFAAFQMSPDEVAALSYLSRGTNSQSLSESSNEYKLIAARDGGLRPLLMSLEDFFNERLIPKINPEWAKMVQFNFEGLDAQSEQAEASQLQMDAALHMTMNQLLTKVEKEKVSIGGDMPMNPAYLAVIEKYYTKGEILQAFGGDKYKNADKDQSLQYYMGDPVWLQMQQMQMQQQAMQQQQGQQQQQAQAQLPELARSGDLDSAVGQLDGLLNKSEASITGPRKELLKKHKEAKKRILDQYEKDAKHMTDSLMAAINGGKPHNCDDEGCD